jgi:hypothetical protein
MSTDKFILNGLKEGLHGEVKVTPILTSSGTRIALPTTQLLRRKTVAVYNLGTSTDILWLGSENVSTEETTTSGIPLYGQKMLSLDLSRSVLYGITTVSGLNIKVLEIA